ncbi:MAG: hypothetical protein WDN06_14780 [Asticcacaulis sp.]
MLAQDNGKRRGVNMIAVPAAFTVPTGRAHWEVLLRARAIRELAPSSWPRPRAVRTRDGRVTYGHSLVVGAVGRGHRPARSRPSGDPHRHARFRRSDARPARRCRS